MHQVGMELHSDRPNLNRLRWAGVVIPLLAIIAGETARFLVPGGEGDMIAHLLWGAAAGAAVILFALSMFWSIGRAEREMVRHNHELGAVNAVSAAVQDASSTDSLVAAAVRSIVNATGAARASVQVFPADGVGSEEPITWEDAQAAPDIAGNLPIELPLTTGSAVIGLLRVWLPREQVTDLSTPALQNISHQLGCAIQLHRLVEDLQRRQAETSALYELAIQISDQRPLADTLAQVTRTVRGLLRADEVAICLTPAASVTVLAADGPELAERLPGVDADGRVCMTATSDAPMQPHRGATVCPVRSSPKYRQALDVTIRSSDVELGDIWVARTDDHPFATIDRETLAGLADVSAVAITSAQLRERERLTATVAERERIARELHDSLAQVLGVTHLRLRAVLGDPVVLEAPRVRQELDDLADMAQEAFRDVREAILGLREASQVEKGFLPGLAAYLEKFGRQASIRVRLDAAPDLEPDLGPHSEIQLIRVIQEALANVRKHAEAHSATVRVAQDASGTTIEIEDDGRGFDTSLQPGDAGGYGLMTMRERMALVGGSFWIDSSVGTGTRIVAHVPRDRRRPAPSEGGTGAGEPAAPHPAGR